MVVVTQVTIIIITIMIIIDTGYYSPRPLVGRRAPLFAEDLEAIYIYIYIYISVTLGWRETRI